MLPCRCFGAPACRVFPDHLRTFHACLSSRVCSPVCKFFSCDPCDESSAFPASATRTPLHTSPPPVFRVRPRPLTPSHAWQEAWQSERAKQNEPLPGLNNRCARTEACSPLLPNFAGRVPTRTQWAPLRPSPLRPPDRCSTAYQIMLDPSGRAGCKGKVRGSVYYRFRR